MPNVRTSAPLSACRIGVVSTYPPKLCGLATFTAALAGALRRAHHRVDVVAIDDGPGDMAAPPGVVAVLRNGNGTSIRHAAAVLSLCDVAVVQHEYGIYGGPDGDEVLDLLSSLTVPAVVVLHTVPLTPTAGQREVLETIAVRAARLVVMSETARTRLLAGYRIDPDMVVTIPHGASLPVAVSAPVATPAVRSPQLLTWGLLGPGKGVEHVIDALAILGRTGQRPRYTVAGVTHPKVLARDGDAYRTSLIGRTWSTGVAGTVTFDDSYRDVRTLMRFVASASIVVLPYDSRDQVTSGVLVDALAAGRPVIATAFPHAVELLSDGAGVLVPHEDPLAMADAIRQVTSDHRLLADMGEAASRLAPSLSWPAVAARYVDVVRSLDASDLTVAI